MKTYWSAILPLLLLLVACGKEEFGTASKTATSQATPLEQYVQNSCSAYTLIKPKVDVLYVVDNSTSTYYIDEQVRSAIKSTVDSISTEFDYRVVGTSILPVSASNPYDYQVFTNSTDPLPDPGKKIISSSQLDFFTTKVSGTERGLSRTIDFIGNHPSLFRTNAYLLIVLISNGRDADVETTVLSNGQTSQNSTAFTARKASFDSIKTTKNLLGLKFFSVTAKTHGCRPGWLTSNLSYVAMSQYYGAYDNYDLCSESLSGVFSQVNSSIRQVVIPHKYKYWPITFTDGENIDLTSIRVYKSTPGIGESEMPASQWDYYSNAARSSINTRIEPTPGEPTSARHMIEFTSGNEVVYPSCVTIRSTSKLEYFGYVVMPKEPVPSSIVVRINGNNIPASAYSYVGSRMNQNIKMPHPTAADQYPAVYRSGFMIQITNSSYYYKSGDSVEIFYTPQGI